MKIFKDWTPRDFIVLIFLIMNAALVYGGHQQLDREIIRVSEQTARMCPSLDAASGLALEGSK